VSLAIAQPTDLYAAALHSMTEPEGHRHWYARSEGGPRRSLGEALRRWCGTADPVDQDLLARAPGAVLDVGCGPGRLVVELARQGREAAGIDTSRVAVRLARTAGATALCRSVFDPMPGEGGWDAVLLADGNIGIGGDPAMLLARCRELVGPAGRVLVELDPPGTGLRADRVRLERGAERGRWFDWAQVGADAVDGPAADAGLRVEETWERGGRSFAALVPTGRGI
jgi:SAM-dependent methyltransferase